jgi:hypothetical protein
MEKKQVVLLQEALTKVKEAEDLLVQIKLYVEDWWYISRVDKALEHLYWARREVDEVKALFDLT